MSIKDNDTPGIEVQHTNASTNVSEDGASDTYLIRLKSVPANIVTVRTTPDAQVRTSPASVTFDSANWETWQTVTISAVDDARVEGEHLGSVLHTADSIDPFYMGVKGDVLTATITDNDVAGVQASSADGSVYVKEGTPGTCDTVNVVLTAQPTYAVTIRVFPDDTPDVLVLPANGVVFAPDQWNVPQQVTICAIDDTVAEGAETKSLTVRSYSQDKFYNGGTWPSLTVRIDDNDAAVITRHEPHDQRYITVSRNDALAGRFTVRLFDAPTSPVKVYINYPTKPKKDLTGSVDHNNKKTTKKFLTFNSTNWNRPQSVRVWYQPGAGGKGVTMRTITFRVQSKDRRYNGMRPRGIKVRIVDNNTVGSRFRAGEQPATGAGATGGTTTTAPAKSSAPLVAAPLPKAAPGSVLATLPAAVATWDPNSLAGRFIDQPWATYENGTTAKGGAVTLVRVMQGSEQGFENVDHAAKLIRTTRKAQLAEWTRDTRAFVLQGSDRRFYVYEAKLAPAGTATQPLEGAIAIYAFGVDWASWRRDEDAAWRAAADTAIS